MKEEKLFEAIADINEDYVADAHKRSDRRRANPRMRWVAVAACLCVAVIAAIAIPKIKAPVQTPDEGPASATTTLYNGKTYLALIMPEELVSVGLPERITEDIIGEHVAYLTLSGEVADYTETDQVTDIELYTCTIETSKEVFILRDGEACWPIVGIEEPSQ